ncbi:MAG: TonB-dependent receptor [Bacteroidales bacterium]
MKKLKLIIAAFVILLISFAANSQTAQTGIIKGKITDKTTKQALPGVTVLIKGTQSGTSTDISGIFMLKNINEGVYTIVISYIGYQVKTLSDIQILKNKTTYHEIELEEAVTGLKGFTITAHRFENNRLAPVSAYSFSREEISRNPGAQGDIFRAIGMLPGVSSSGGEYSAIAVRGQGSRDNVYMVDDIPVTQLGHLEGYPSSESGFNDPNGGRFSIFAPRVIDNAEFQGGGFNAQYGRRSASFLGLGIKEGNKENPIIDGQLDLMGVTINYDGPSYLLKNTGLFLSARYQNLQQVENIAGLKNLGLPKYQDFIFKSTSQLGSKNKLSLIAIYSPENFMRNTDNVKEDKNLNNLLVIDNTKNNAIVGINLRTLVGKNNYFKNIIYYSGLTSKSSFGMSYPKTDASGKLINADNIPFEEGVKTTDYTESKLGYRFIHSIRFANASNLTTGIDLDRLKLKNNRNLSRTDTSYVFNMNDFRPNPLQYFTLTDPAFFNVDITKTSYNASAYVNYSFLLMKKLSLNAGLRYDYSGFSDQHTLSPRLSGSYQLNETNSINFATGIYYQDPVYSEIADQPSTKKLKSEKISQVILGYKKYFTPELKLTVETWYKNFGNMVVRPFSSRVEQNNSGDGFAYGLDINVTKRLTNKVHGQIGYSYMQSNRNNHDGFGENDFAFSQPHQLNFLIAYQAGKQWILSTKFRYATGKPCNEYSIHSNIFNNSDNIRYSQEITAINKNRLPDFISLDIRADYKFKIKQLGLSAFIDIVDVLNRQNANGESFNFVTGKTFYDGISIFPTFGLKFQL